MFLKSLVSSLLEASVEDPLLNHETGGLRVIQVHLHASVHEQTQLSPAGGVLLFLFVGI